MSSSNSSPEPMISTASLEQPKGRKTNIFLTIFFFILLGITYLAWRYPNVGEMLNVFTWFGADNPESMSIWIAIGFTMILCFIGAIIPVPVPYALPVATFSYQWIQYYEPAEAWTYIILLMSFSALANAIGDSLDYIIGKGTQSVLKKDDPAFENRWAHIILTKPQAIPFVVFLFAVTPLPDSLLLMPLGLVKYSFKKMFGWMYLGKILMMVIVGISGIYGIEWLLSIIAGEGSWVTGVALLYAMWAMIVFMVKFKPKIPETSASHSAQLN